MILPEIRVLVGLGGSRERDNICVNLPLLSYELDVLSVLRRLPCERAQLPGFLPPGWLPQAIERNKAATE